MKDWEILEKKIAKLTGGKATPGSGSKQTKGDLRVSLKGSVVYIECKFRSFDTEPNKHTLPNDWFETCENHCRKSSMLPVLVFQPQIDNVIKNPHFFIRSGDLLEYDAISTIYKCPDKWKEISEDDLVYFFRINKK
jgi:hypothetical protein